MNRRIKKKKAKQLAQKKQIELENKLRKLSQEEIEVLSRMIKQIVSDISKAFSKIFATFLTANIISEYNSSSKENA